MQQLAAKIPWSHNILLMEKVKGLPVRLWYMQQTIEHGWSRDTLAAMIKAKSRGSIRKVHIMPFRSIMLESWQGNNQ